MVLLGAAINAAAIFLGGGLGLLLKKGLPQKIQNTLMAAMALCVLIIGVKGALKTENILITVISMAAGAVIGEVIDIDAALNKFGNFLQRKFIKSSENSTFGEGFVTTTLYVCVGAMAIVGAIEAGMKGDLSTYYAKSLLDAVAVLIFTSTLGAGCLLSGVVVFLYEGLMTFGASYISGFLTDTIINEMSAVGSLIIIAIALNMLKITKIKVGNLVLATFFPIILCQFM